MSDAIVERTQAGLEGDWICVGAITGTYGVKGELRLKSFTEKPADIFSFTHLHKGVNGPVLSLRKIRSSKEGFIVRMEGVTSPEQGATLRGMKVFIPRESLVSAEEDEYFLADLIGLKALDEAGEEIGFVRAVENYGAEDLLELVLLAPMKGLGRYVFIPFRKELVPDISLVTGTVTVAFDLWKKTQASERDGEGVENDSAT